MLDQRVQEAAYARARHAARALQKSANAATAVVALAHDVVPVVVPVAAVDAVNSAAQAPEEASLAPVIHGAGARAAAVDTQGALRGAQGGE